MQVGLAPTLNEAEKLRVQRWMEVVLADPLLANRREIFPYARRLHVYVDGRAYVVMAGTWQTTGDLCYIGQGGEETTLQSHQKLAVLAALITSLDLWEALAEAYSTAMSKALLDQYNTMMSGLLVSRGAIATGLAFNSERRLVAARMGGAEDNAFYLPNGSDVTAEVMAPENNWTVVN